MSTIRGDKIWGPIQTTEWAMGVIYLRLKSPGREDDHSSPSCGEFKNVWISYLQPVTRLSSVVRNGAHGKVYIYLGNREH
jgi:hypothetical protein